MSEQEHKIASVVDVVRRIIADTQVIKSQLFAGLVPDQNNEVNDFMQDGGTAGIHPQHHPSSTSAGTGGSGGGMPPGMPPMG